MAHLASELLAALPEGNPGPLTLRTSLLEGKAPAQDGHWALVMCRVWETRELE